MKATQDKTRGGNHLNWGVAPRKSAPGIAIRAVWATGRPFFGFGAWPGPARPAVFRRHASGPRRPETDPNGGPSGRSGSLPSPKALPCAPKRLQSVTDPHPRPLGVVRSRLWPVLAVFGRFGAVLAPFGPGPGPPPPPFAGATPGAWRIVLAQNSGSGQGTGGGTWGQSFGLKPEPEPEPWLFCFCDVLLLVACCCC